MTPSGAVKVERGIPLSVGELRLVSQKPLDDAIWRDVVYIRWLMVEAVALLEQERR